MIFKKYKKKKKPLNLGDKFVRVEKSIKKRIPLEQKTYAELVNIADTLFAKEVKRRADLGGYVRCWTCGAYLSYSPDKGNPNLHCCHLFSRQYHEIRWDFSNARVGCITCNSFKQGMVNVFEAKLRREIGDQEVDRLREISLRINIQSREALITKISELKKFLKD